MLLNVPGRFRVMICALLAVLGPAGCSSGDQGMPGVGGGSGGATASGGAAGHSSAGSMGNGATGGTASGGVAGAASGGTGAGGTGGAGGSAGAAGPGTGGTAGATPTGGASGGGAGMPGTGGAGGHAGATQTGGAGGGAAGMPATGGAGGHAAGGTGGAGPNRKAFVVGLPTAAPTAGDTVMAGRLKALGFSVTFVSDQTVSANTVAGADLILISSSAESGNLGTRLRDVAIPIFCVENGQYPNQGMTPAGVGTGEGSVLSQTAVTIAAAAGPLGGGLSGNVTISSKAGELGWGAPPAGATVAATVVGQTNHVTIFGFAKGDQMVGMTAPARRAGFAIREDLAANLSTEGIKLFDSIVAWVTQ